MKIPKQFRQLSAAEVSPAATLAHLSEAIGSRKGGMFELTVYHDDDCPYLNGKGPCVCNAEYKLGRPGPGEGN